MAKEHDDLLDDGEWIWADSAYPVRHLMRCDQMSWPLDAVEDPGVACCTVQETRG